MIQKSPNNWSCLPTAFAIVLAEPVSEIIRELGHDGSRKLWPGRPEPECRQGFHPAELIRYCWKKHISVSTHEVFPLLAAASGGFIDWTSTHSIYTMEQAKAQAEKVLERTALAIVGGVSAHGCRHAIAKRGFDYYCPNLGRISSIADFKVSHIYVIDC